MTLTEIKKNLYKENPTAILANEFNLLFYPPTSFKTFDNDKDIFIEALTDEQYNELNSRWLEMLKSFKFTHLNYYTETALGYIDFSIPIEEAFYEGKSVFNLKMPAKELIRWIKITDGDELQSTI